MASNLIDITSPEQFKEVLSKDLNRVSCLNFWAPWAEPCEVFNKEIAAASSKYPSILFLNVSTPTPSSCRTAFDVEASAARDNYTGCSSNRRSPFNIYP
jgi:thiol-disulfide isomerase/thioredoxin